MADDNPDDILDTEPAPFEFCKSDDELRRAWIFGILANSDIAGTALVENMALVERWLKTGETGSKDKPALKVARG
jgi:hypothetical protein